MALKIRLRQNEKVIINGAVIQNGSRATSILLQNFAQVLREPEVMQEEEANTPVRRAYFACQLMLVDPTNAAEYRTRFNTFLKDLRGALINPVVLAELDAAEQAIEQKNYYMALRHFRIVMDYESILLAPPPTDPVSDSADTND